MSREKPPSPKTEALTAIAEAMTLLRNDAPMDGMKRFRLRATLEYAAEQVAMIAERTRARPVKA